MFDTIYVKRHVSSCHVLKRDFFFKDQPYDTKKLIHASLKNRKLMHVSININIYNTNFMW
jgi:hypothetical protein